MAGPPAVRVVKFGRHFWRRPICSSGIGEGTDVVARDTARIVVIAPAPCARRHRICCACLQHGLLSQGVEALRRRCFATSVPRPPAAAVPSDRRSGLGLSRARSDVEVIALAWDLLANLGVGGLALELNSLGTAEDRQDYRDALVAWLEQRSEALDADSQARLSTNPLRILDSKNKETQALLEDAPTLADALSDASRERFEEVQRGRLLWGPLRLNPRLVRGLITTATRLLRSPVINLGPRPPCAVVVTTVNWSLEVPRPPPLVGLSAWNGCCWC